MFWKMQLYKRESSHWLRVWELF